MRMLAESLAEEALSAVTVAVKEQLPVEVARRVTCWKPLSPGAMSLTLFEKLPPVKHPLGAPLNCTPVAAPAPSLPYPM